MNFFKNDYEITNIINYLRRSRQDVQKEKTTGEDTLAAQEKLMTHVLNNLGIPYTQQKEIGSGDKISTRPVFKKVFKDLEEGKYDAIAVKEISRMGRGSYKDMGSIFELITEKRIFIITPNKIYDPSNSNDLRQIRFEMFMAREEYESIRERLTGARYNAALEGKWMGQIPFGYTRSKKTMRLEPKDGEKEIVQMIFDLFVNGYNGKQVRERSIATILKRAGIKTARDNKIWDTTQLKRVLTNDVYIGVSKFRTTRKNAKGKVEKRKEEDHIIVPEAHTAIISKEMFEKVQEIKKHPASSKTKFDVDTYELTGLFTCKKCGKKTVVNRYKRKRLNDEYYDTYVKCRNGCFGVKYNFAEESIVNLLKNLKEISENEILEMYENSIIKNDEEEQEILKENFLHQLEQQKSKLEQRQQFIFDKFEEGIYSNEDFLKRKKVIEEELKELESLQLKGGAEEIAAAKEEIDIDETKRKFVNIYDTYKKAKTACEKNEILKNIFEIVIMEVLEKGTKKHAPKINYEISLTNKFWEPAAN